MIPRALQGVRGDRQGADDEARLEGAGARLPRDDQAAAEAGRARRSTSSRSACSTGSARSTGRASSTTRARSQAFEIAQQLDPNEHSDARARSSPSSTSCRGPRLRRQGGRAAHARCCATSRSSTTRTRRCAASTWTRTSTTRPGASATRSRSCKKADPDELQFYEQYKPRGLVKAKNVMTDEIVGQARPPRREPLHQRDLRRDLAGRRRDEGVHRTRTSASSARTGAQLQGDQLMFSKLFYYVGAGAERAAAARCSSVEDNKPGDIQLANAHREERAVPVVRGAPAPAAGQERARDRVPVGAPADVHAAGVLPEAAAADEHRAQGRRSCRRS